MDSGLCGATHEGVIGGDNEHFFDKKLLDFRVFDKGLRSKIPAWLPQIKALSCSASLVQCHPSNVYAGISGAPKLKNPRTVIGHSELLSRRTKSKPKRPVEW
jgi:hypothetical protein